MSSTTMKIGSGIHWVSRGFFYLGWVAASVMLVITCYDVFMRYLFCETNELGCGTGCRFIGIYGVYLCCRVG